MHTFTLEHQIINSSSYYDLVVKVKSGITYIARKPSNTDFNDNKQVIKILLKNIHLKDIEINELDAITLLDREIVKRLNAIITSFREKPDDFEYPKDIGIEIELNSSLANEDSSINSEMLGLTIWPGKGHINKKPKNIPTSTLREAITSLEASTKVSNMLHYCVYLNDPECIQNPLYVNVLGRSKAIPILSDNSKDPGLYIGLSSGETPLETLSYRFEDLTDKVLEGIGVFRTKVACDKGGNTERYLEAEELLRTTSKSLEHKTKQLEEAKSKLDKAEKDLDNLNRVVEDLKLDHKRLVHSSRTEAKSTSERSKLEEVIKNHQIEQLKNKNKSGFWLDILKGAVSVTGLFLNGFKMFFR